MKKKTLCVIQLINKFRLRKKFNIYNNLFILNMTTTNLDDLPLSPQSEPNVNIKINDNTINNLQEQRKTEMQNINNSLSQQQQSPQQQQPNNNMDVNSFITGIQNAAANGGLELPSRDIPQNQSHITQDSQLIPNYIPEENNNYIENDDSFNEMIKKNIKPSNTNNIDILYDDLHVPIILAVIYFVFQLPIIKKNTLKYIPSLFLKDGNYNIAGYIVNSLAFASTYYFTIKSIDYLTI